MKDYEVIEIFKNQGYNLWHKNNANDDKYYLVFKKDFPSHNKHYKKVIKVLKSNFKLMGGYIEIVDSKVSLIEMSFIKTTFLEEMQHLLSDYAIIETNLK